MGELTRGALPGLGRAPWLAPAACVGSRRGLGFGTPGGAVIALAAGVGPMPSPAPEPCCLRGSSAHRFWPDLLHGQRWACSGLAQRCPSAQTPSRAPSARCLYTSALLNSGPLLAGGRGSARMVKLCFPGHWLSVVSSMSHACPKQPALCEPLLTLRLIRGGLRCVLGAVCCSRFDACSLLS